MITHLKGKLIEKNPTNIVVDCNGVGYSVNISLHTFSQLPSGENVKLFIHLQIREDLKTRLVWGLVFQMHALSDSEKLQALQQAATERGLQISSEVAPWLLKHFHRDMPSLMSLLEALDNYSLETKRAITLPLLKEMLAQKN